MKSFFKIFLVLAVTNNVVLADTYYTWYKPSLSSTAYCVIAEYDQVVSKTKETNCRNDFVYLNYKPSFSKTYRCTKMAFFGENKNNISVQDVISIRQMADYYCENFGATKTDEAVKLFDQGKLVDF